MYNIPREIIPLILSFFRKNGEKDEYMFHMVNNIIYKQNLYLESELERKYKVYFQKSEQNIKKYDNISLDQEINMIPLDYSDDFKFIVEDFRIKELLELKKNWTLRFFEIMDRRFKYSLLDHFKLLGSGDRLNMLKMLVLDIINGSTIWSEIDKDFILLNMNIRDQLCDVLQQKGININMFSLFNINI